MGLLMTIIVLALKRRLRPPNKNATLVVDLIWNHTARFHLTEMCNVFLVLLLL
jgi:hypothetical protein